MDFELIGLSLPDAARHKAAVLVVLVADDFAAGDDALSGLIGQALRSEDFRTKAGTVLAAYRPAGLAATRLVLAGTGAGDGAGVQAGVQAALKIVRHGPAQELTLLLPDGADVAVTVMAAAEAAYVYRSTKTEHTQPPLPPEVTRISVAVADVDRASGDFDGAVAVAHGVALAREWANRPANHATPTRLAEAARKLVGYSSIRCKVLGPKAVARLGMGALQAVAAGSAEELRFIELRYDGGGSDDAPVVLVGKGITFDSGGISIKPAAAMDEMKFDMCGAASVLGVFRALAEARPAVNVVGLIASCENLPGAAAVKPGDVITGMSGQTIEVLNTDAEGRLVLSDALTYAQRFKPRAVIDIATLTGACVIALGGVRSGLFCTDDALADALLQAGEAAQDPCWRMPLDDAYAKDLRSHFADVANVAGRPAGAVTAAKFLQCFVADWPWAHFDIAGTAWKTGDAKGATGRPVRLLMQYLLDQADAAADTAPAGNAGGKRKTASGKDAAGRASGSTGR
ncbi:MAG: leucyl aminopeptidase [Ottowia sp.]|nr:leucyl aminopeptidase [Ottowia sp.]